MGGGEELLAAMPVCVPPGTGLAAHGGGAIAKVITGKILLNVNI